MFKKTITELKEINETPKEVIVSTTIDSDKIAKNVIRTYAALVVLGVAGRVAITITESKHPKYQNNQTN